MDKLIGTSFLSRKVIAAIDPWVLSAEEPPFTEPQLVAMALVMSGRPITIEEIFVWISDTFRFYRERIAVGCWLQFWDPHDRRVYEIRHFQNMLSHAFRQYEFETHCINDEKNFTISAVNADIYLRPVIGDPYSDSTKTFDFFGLPAELREVIYEMVFAYPKSGLEPTSRIDSRFRVSSRSFEEGLDFKTWEGTLAKRTQQNHILYLFTKSISNILAPLTINRQFYEEAMPIFYRINHFRFTDVHGLDSFLSGLAPARREHLAHISFYYSSYTTDEKFAENAFKLLSEIDYLRRLDIRIFENKWTQQARPNDLKTYQSVKDIPGLKVLKSLRGLEEVTFHGPCPKVEEMLRESMLKPKPKRRTRTNTYKGVGGQSRVSWPWKAKKTIIS